MNIAIFSECYEPVVNGVVVSIKTFRRELIARGHTVYVFAPAYKGFRDEDPHVFRFASFKFPRQPDYPLALPFRRLPPCYPELGVELVHSQSPFALGRLGAKAARRYDVPLVYTFHTMITEYTHYVPLPQPLLRAGARQVIRNYCALADWVIAPTSVIRDYLRELGVRTPIAVIPTGVELPPASADARQAVRERYAVPADAWLLVSAGRLAKEKNIGFLLRAFARVAEREDAYLLFLGGGPWEKQSREMARELGIEGRVRLPGFVPHEEVADCLAAGDLFVYASTTDTQAIVVAEALAAGLPAVAVRAFGPAEVIVDGESGVLVEEDEGRFASEVVRLLNDEGERARMSARARERARHFSPKVCCDKLLEVYSKALSGRGEEG